MQDIKRCLCPGSLLVNAYLHANGSSCTIKVYWQQPWLSLTIDLQLLPRRPYLCAACSCAPSCLLSPVLPSQMISCISQCLVCKLSHRFPRLARQECGPKMWHVNCKALKQNSKRWCTQCCWWLFAKNRYACSWKGHMKDADMINRLLLQEHEF